MSFDLHLGDTPLLISMPHVGTHIPPELRAQFCERALGVEDTDWHLGELYGFAPGLGASTIKPHTSRYVIDLNRPSDNAPMYPGAANTELCPTRFFTGDALYLSGHEPDPAEIDRRRSFYWQPYHDALQTELDRLRTLHGFVLLWDAHSIRSHIPWLFDGKLPDLNLGTASGASAHASIADATSQVAANQPGLTSVINGRFKGGFITRHYGQPSIGVHAIQLEKCQSLYMAETAPFAYDAANALALQPVLIGMITAAVAAAKALHSSGARA